MSNSQGLVTQLIEEVSSFEFEIGEYKAPGTESVDDRLRGLEVSLANPLVTLDLNRDSFFSGRPNKVKLFLVLRDWYDDAQNFFKVSEMFPFSIVSFVPNSQLVYFTSKFVPEIQEDMSNYLKNCYLVAPIKQNRGSRASYITFVGGHEFFEDWRISVNVRLRDIILFGRPVSGISNPEYASLDQNTVNNYVPRRLRERYIQSLQTVKNMLLAQTIEHVQV